MQKGVPGVPSAVLSCDPFTHDCLTQAPCPKGCPDPKPTCQAGVSRQPHLWPAQGYSPGGQ